MNNLAVVGAQWGDEGKGKIVDLLSGRFRVVARFQGGPNAGHTVVIGDERYALHHIPSGVFHADVCAIIGNGTVVDLEQLVAEIEGLEERGVALRGRLFVSDRAHVILPAMKQLDALVESSVEATQRIGTTLRGIGPTYEAKAARQGIRLGDLADPDEALRKVRRLLDGPLGQRLRAAGEDPGSPERITAALLAPFERLDGFVADTVAVLHAHLEAGDAVLFEGAQGTLLDLDHGAYPFVTSSNTVAGGLCAGLGVPPSAVGAVLGVYKAYATRVGGGPMPTELVGEEAVTGQRLRDRGREYGTTTGRPRRCGWFDGVAGAYARKLNGFRTAALMLLDVLDAFEEVRLCIGYRLNGRPLPHPPSSLAAAVRVEPVYETLPGWMRDTTGVRRWEDLPPEAQAYVQRVEAVIGCEVGLVSVGPERSQTLLRPGSWFAERFGS